LTATFNLSSTPMTTQDDPPSLESLGNEIRRLQEKTAPKPDRAPQSPAAAMQVGLEIVCGVLVGTGAGIVLDRWLGTSPLLLLVCFFLGTAGGVLTVYRTTVRPQAQRGSDATTDKGKRNGSS
jgi:ATP synthase protein I